MKNMWGIGESFLLIYAPRDDAELEILGSLITASAIFMTGEQKVTRP